MMMKTLVATVVLLAVCVAGVAGLTKDTPYYQPMTTKMAYTSAPNPGGYPVVSIPLSTPVTHLVALTTLPSAALAVTSTGLYTLTSAGAKPVTLASPLSAPSRGSVLGGGYGPGVGEVALVNENGSGWVCPESSVLGGVSTGCTAFAGSSYTNLTAPVVVGGGRGTYWGDADGLYVVQDGEGEGPVRIQQADLPAYAPDLKAIHTLAFDGATNTLSVGAHRALFHLDGDGVWTWTWRHGFISAAPSTLTYDPTDSVLWVGAKDALVSVLPNSQILRYDGVARVPALAGLPHGNHTDSTLWMALDGGERKLVLGTKYGVVIRNLVAETWAYYVGPRWLVSDKVNAVAASPGGGAVYIASEYGITVLEFPAYTLAQKEAHYMDILLTRHNRYGLTGDCRLGKFGQLDTWANEPNDNNGLWTGMVVAGLAYKYGVTGEESDRANAWHYFEGIELLMNVTNIPGYVARSVWPYGSDPGSGLWWNSTNPAYAKVLQWKGDTSSDEITGHIYGALIAHKMGIASNEEERGRVVRHITALVDGLMEHDYTLWGHYGNRTTWGVWSPEYLNGKYSWRDERGVNSAQALGFLSAAYEVTGDQKYLTAMGELVKDHGYGSNLVNIKITWRGDGNPEGKNGGAGSVGDINFSDDELSFLPLATLDESPSGSSSLRSQYLMGMETLYARVATEKSSLWNAIYAQAHGGASNPANADLMADAVETLRQWPLSLVAWPIDNTQRIDVFLMPDLTRGNGLQALQLIPYDESSFFRWNGNPFSVSKGGSGMSESDPGAWLLPFWMARYHGLIQ